MMRLQDLLQVNSENVKDFFYDGLKETDTGERLADFQVQYLASVLAHYSQYSIGNPSSSPTPPASLVEVFDQFILTESFHEDVEILHLAGSQCLFMLSCFWTQMERRHNRRWFMRYGRAYYYRASYLAKTQGERRLFWTVGRDFEPCIQASQELFSELRDAPYLIH